MLSEETPEIGDLVVGVGEEEQLDLLMCDGTCRPGAWYGEIDHVFSTPNASPTKQAK